MEYKITQFLNDFLEKNGTGVTEVASKVKMSQPYVTYIKSGKKTASKKFLNNLMKAYPKLLSKEKELMSMLEEDKKYYKLKEIEKNKNQVLSDLEMAGLENGIKIGAREKRQFNEVISSADYFFNDENVSLEDKEKMLISLQELFFEAKVKNKKKG